MKLRNLFVACQRTVADPGKKNLGANGGLKKFEGAESSMCHDDSVLPTPGDKRQTLNIDISNKSYYTVSQKKRQHFYFCYNSTKQQPIFKFLSPLEIELAAE